MLVFKGVRGCFLVAQMISAFLPDVFLVLDMGPSWMIFVQDHLQVVDVNMAPQNIPKKKHKIPKNLKRWFLSV